MNGQVNSQFGTAVRLCSAPLIIIFTSTTSLVFGDRLISSIYSFKNVFLDFCQLMSDIKKVEKLSIERTRTVYLIIVGLRQIAN